MYFEFLELYSMFSIKNSSGERIYRIHHNTILKDYPYKKNIIKSIKYNDASMFKTFVRKIKIGKRFKDIFLNKWIRLCTIHSAYLVRTYLENEYK